MLFWTVVFECIDDLVPMDRNSHLDAYDLKFPEVYRSVLMSECAWLLVPFSDISCPMGSCKKWPVAVLNECWSLAFVSICFPICVMSLTAQHMRLACACMDDYTAGVMRSVVFDIIFSNCCRLGTVNGTSCCCGGRNGATAGSFKSE